MKRAIRILCIAALLAFLAIALIAPAANAAPGDRASGHLTYMCPFGVAPVDADFVVYQTGPSFVGKGYGTFYYGLTDRVTVKLVNVVGDRCYFAGPVVGGGAWWYFAVQAGTAGDDGRAVGIYCRGKADAFRLVSSESDLSEFSDLFADGFYHGLQPLQSGWVKVW